MEPFRGKASGKTIRAGTGMDPLEAAQLSRSDLYERIKALEAEVERLRHLGGAPPGVSPSPTPCGCKDEREAAIVHGSGYHHAAANPAARPPRPKWAVKWCEVDGWSDAQCSCPDDPPTAVAANPAARKERVA